MSIQKAYRDEFTPFEIDSIEYEDDARGSPPSSISFEYEGVAMSVDTAGRFATHEIIGGSTVRQKIGEEPIEVSISGVCFESTAKDIDRLRDAMHGTIYSGRLPGGSLTVQFASSTTSPMSDSGAVDLTEGKFLYSFTLECVEVIT